MGLPLRVRSKPPLPPGAERRRFERFPLLAQVELRVHGEVLVLPIVNVSAGGMLVQLEPGAAIGLAIGEQVSVFLDLEEPPISVTLDGTIVRVDAAGTTPTSVAITWTAPKPTAFAMLVKLLDYLRTQQP